MSEPQQSSCTIDRIQRFLAEWQTRDLILAFDSEFDVPFRQGLCVGLLEMLGADEAPEAGLVSSAERLGYRWCRIVRADVHYALPEGLELVESSRTRASRLHEQLERDEGRSLNAEERRFVGYVLARFHDGAGKIHYRCADFSNARFSFEIAKRIACEMELWECLPDIVSNWLRTDYEERTQVAHPKELVEEYRQAIVEHQSRRQTEWWQRATATQRREFARGLSSLFHNLSVELKRCAGAERVRALLNESLECSVKSQQICEELGDEYRLGQALNHQAFLALELQQVEIARSLFERVLTLKGPRSRRIAVQNLAAMDCKAGHLAAADASLSQLIAELRAEREQTGGDLGLDYAFHYNTVERWRNVLTHPGAGRELGAVDGRLQQAARERIEAVRSIRKVVKISQYKQAFSKLHAPVFRELIGRRVASFQDLHDERDRFLRLEETCSLVEEASARELMDLLQNQTASGVEVSPSELPDAAIITFERGSSGEASLRKRRGSFEARRFRSPALDQSRLYEALAERRAAYERLSLRHPIATTQHNPLIAHDLRMFTANNPELIVARYFSFQRDSEAVKGSVAAAERDFGVFLFCAGDMQYIPLDTESILQKVLPLARAHSDGPPIAVHARRIFKILIEPVLKRFDQKELAGRELVVVPCDELFGIPFHVAMDAEGMPLGARLPTAYSVSASAFLHRGRHLLRRQRVYETDHCCAVLYRDDEVSCSEVLDLDWPETHLMIAGSAPKGMGPHVDLGAANWAAMASMTACEPEFFLYSGHGVYLPEFGVLGPALVLDEDVMTQYDVAMRLRLPHNRVTFLAACVSGEGGSLEGGELSGFLRAFMAAGAGALGVTLWPVLDESIASTVRHVLREALSAARGKRMFEVMRVIHDEYRRCCSTTHLDQARIEACPIALYL